MARARLFDNDLLLRIVESKLDFSDLTLEVNYIKSAKNLRYQGFKAGHTIVPKQRFNYDEVTDILITCLKGIITNYAPTDSTKLDLYPVWGYKNFIQCWFEGYPDSKYYWKQVRAYLRVEGMYDGVILPEPEIYQYELRL